VGPNEGNVFDKRRMTMENFQNNQAIPITDPTESAANQQLDSSLQQ